MEVVGLFLRHRYRSVSDELTTGSDPTCGHTHPDNRKRQALFSCSDCGHTENADRNAAEVIKKRAIKLILNSGTELSQRGVLCDGGVGLQLRREERKPIVHAARKRQKRREMRDNPPSIRSPLFQEEVVRVIAKARRYK
jgi:hypothetical protein